MLEIWAFTPDNMALSQKDYAKIVRNHQFIIWTNLNQLLRGKTQHFIISLKHKLERQAH